MNKLSLLSFKKKALLFTLQSFQNGGIVISERTVEKGAKCGRDVESNVIHHSVSVSLNDMRFSN